MQSRDSQLKAIWAGELATLLVGKAIEIIVLGVLAALVFPLITWLAYLLLAVILITLVLRLTRPLSWRFIVLILIFFLTLATVNLAALGVSTQSKFIVPADSLVESLTIRQYQGPAGTFYVVPVNTFTTLKRLIFEWIAGRNSSFVVLEAVSTARGFIVNSPTELALARLSAPDGIGTRRAVRLPYLRRELVANISPAEFQLSYGVRTATVSLTTDVGSDRVGLFGVRSAAPPSAETWRRVAFGEELIRSLHYLDAHRLIALLEEEAVQTGEERDLLRLIVFRLLLIPQRYRTLPAQTTDGMFDAALIGNLRWIAARFAERAPSLELAEDPWGWSLEQSALEYLNWLNLSMQSLPNQPINTGQEWIVETLRRSVEYRQRQGFTVKDVRADEGQQTQDGHRIEQLIERVHAGANWQTIQSEFVALFRQSIGVQEDPLALGDQRRVQEFVQIPGSLLRPEVVQWIGSDAARRPSRAYRLYEAAKQRCMAPVELVLAQEWTIETLSDVLSEMFATCADAQRFVPLLPDPLQRRVLGDEIRSQTRVFLILTRWMSALARCSSAVSENLEEECVITATQRQLAAVEPVLAQAFPRLFTDSCGPGCNGAAKFETAMPVMGAPYSAEEFVYVLYAVQALVDVEHLGLSPRLCRRVEADFDRLLEEDNIFDRLTLLNVHAAMLRRCGSTRLQVFSQHLRNHELPLAAWQGFLSREVVAVRR